MQEEIRLSRNNWWKELEQKDLPQDIVMLLRELIGSHMKSAILPEAKPRLIALAKDCLSKGIWIGDSEFFDVMVYMPEDKVKYRSFFVLVPKWSGGELKRLAEL